MVADSIVCMSVKLESTACDFLTSIFYFQVVCQQFSNFQLVVFLVYCSVARGRTIVPTIDMQNMENITFLALMRLIFALK